MPECKLNDEAMARIESGPLVKPFAEYLRSLAKVAIATGAGHSEIVLNYVDDESALPEMDLVPEIVLRVRQPND